MSQEKPGLSNEEGKPTPGQIGLVDGDKLVEWILENYQKPLGLNSSTAGMVMVKLEIQSGRFSVSGQGQEERDYTPEQILLEKLQELKEGMVMIPTPLSILKNAPTLMPQLTYLAVPYSHPDPAVRLDRFHMANKAAAYLMSKGEIVFSPISHTHPIHLAGSLPGDWQFWEQFDKIYLGYSKKIIVLMLPGWDTSKGVQAEIKIAEELGLLIEYLNPGVLDAHRLNQTLTKEYNQ